MCVLVDVKGQRAISGTMARLQMGERFGLSFVFIFSRNSRLSIMGLTPDYASIKNAYNNIFWLRVLMT